MPPLFLSQAATAGRVCPAGSRRDQQQAYFIGGSEELQDVTYMAVPSGHKGSVLNKYGYKTQTSGNVKVGPCCSRATVHKGLTMP